MLDTWEGGWDSGSSCWTIGREAGVVDLHLVSCWTVGREWEPHYGNHPYKGRLG